MKKEKNTFDISILCVITGVGMMSLAPSLPVIYPAAIFGVGSYYFIDDFLHKSNKWYKLWDSMGIENKPRLREKINTDYGYCLRFGIPRGMSTDDFEKRKSAIYQYIDCDRLNIKHHQGRNMLLEVYENRLKTQYDYYDDLDVGGKLEIPIGYTYGESLVTIDLEEAVHILIAGETDSGKSTLLRAILTYILTRLDIKLYLCDLKFGGTELRIFVNHPNVKEFITNKEDAIKLLTRVEREVRDRGDKISKAGCNDIYKYNRENPKNKLKHEIVVIDEMAILRGKNTKDSIETLEILATQARSTGIHLLLATQRPSKTEKVITGQIKANIPTKIGLRVDEALDSRMIIDSDGLEQLRGNGHGILKLKGKKTEFQGFYLDYAQAQRLINQSANKIKNKKRKVVKNDTSKVMANKLTKEEYEQLDFSKPSKKKDDNKSIIRKIF
ncbi:DNA translocase FtsK [Clostridium sp. D2Q-11]|uniref:DNA translocase FtsK n=1 Tax=Anaeromonas frigoriresistens TaxID=2683708 RepID=A0A942UX97_9FIRM|nr:FtsK/SpoIIIE domain-containing protein [Anaeromonas frigoriresistens]MBS4539790.1 DNA translocase FtsK [Anaeromonas frigoriresistens]